MFGGGAAGVRAWFATDAAVSADLARWESAQHGGHYEPRDHSFFLRTMDLVDAAVLVGMAIAILGLLVALADGIVARSRVYASLVAGGVPRGVLARSVLWHTLTPAVPAVVVALIVGLSLTRAVARESRSGGWTWTMCDANGVCAEMTSPEFVRQIPIPFGDLAFFGGAAILVALAVTGLGLLLLRSSVAAEELRTT